MWGGSFFSLTSSWSFSFYFFHFIFFRSIFFLFFFISFYFISFYFFRFIFFVLFFSFYFFRFIFFVLFFFVLFFSFLFFFIIVIRISELSYKALQQETVRVYVATRKRIYLGFATVKRCMYDSSTQPLIQI